MEEEGKRAARTGIIGTVITNSALVTLPGHPQATHLVPAAEVRELVGSFTLAAVGVAVSSMAEVTTTGPANNTTTCNNTTGVTSIAGTESIVASVADRIGAVINYNNNTNNTALLYVPQKTSFLCCLNSPLSTRRITTGPAVRHPSLKPKYRRSVRLQHKYQHQHQYKPKGAKKKHRHMRRYTN